MRNFNTRLLTLAIIATAPCAAAQDLQYTTVIHSWAPSLSEPVAAPTSTVSIKGARLRIDTHMDGRGAIPATDMAMLVDMSTHKTFVLQPSMKTYVEMPMAFALSDSLRAVADSMRAAMDSMRAAAVATMPQPKVIDTGETQQIRGYNARHLLMAVMPGKAFPAMADKTEQPGMQMVIAADGWFSTDSVLNHMRETMTRMLGSRTDPMAKMFGAKMFGEKMPGGFPLRLTVSLVQIPDSVSPDPAAIMKAGDEADHLFMRMTMEVTDIHTGILDPALFTVPKEYKKDELKN